MCQPFEDLAGRFEEAARKIGTCQDAETRKQMLVQMRSLLSEADEMVLRQAPDLPLVN